MFLFAGAPSRLFTYLNFPGSVGLSLNKCRETNYLSISPHPIRHLLLLKALNLSSRLVTCNRGLLGLRALWLFGPLMKAYSTNYTSSAY